MKTLRPGTVLGGCRVLVPLVRGGMGTLWLGTRVGPAGFARPVAIKVVDRRLAREPRFIDMFLDEARLASRVQHPNIVHVEQLGEQDGIYFMVMEYVRGFSLAEVLNALRLVKRTLPIDVAVHIAMQVADGLHGAHSTADDDGCPIGLVHRDVSPQNVLISRDGYVKLIDFGVAKVSGPVLASAASRIQGKLAYMPPEQARGDEVDRRADVYALGGVLWEMLAGRRLHRGLEEAALLERAKAPSHVPPSRHHAQVTAGLDEVVLTALALDPDDRHPTAQLFRRELGRAWPAAHFVEPDDLAALLTQSMPDEVRVLEVRQADSATFDTWEVSSHAPRVPGTDTWIDPDPGADGVVIPPRPPGTWRALSDRMRSAGRAALDRLVGREGLAEVPEPDG